MAPNGNVVMDYDTICKDIRKARDVFGRKYSKDEENIVRHRKKAFHPPLFPARSKSKVVIHRDPKFLSDDQVIRISQFVLEKRRDELLTLTAGEHACVETLMEDQKYTKYIGITAQYPERKECWTYFQYNSRGVRPFSLPSGEGIYSPANRKRFGLERIRVFDSVFPYNCRLVEGYLQKIYSGLSFPTEKLWSKDDWGRRFRKVETDPHRPACVYLVFSKGIQPALATGELIYQDNELQHRFYNYTKAKGNNQQDSALRLSGNRMFDPIAKQRSTSL